MQLAFQPRVAASVAIVGASLIAVTPVVAPTPELPDVQFRAVQLTAGDDAWTDVFNQSHANATQLIQNFNLAPMVALQQEIVNMVGFRQDLIDDPANITSVTNQMQENLKAVMSAYTLLNADGATAATVINHTLNTQLEAGGLSQGFITAGHNLILSQIGSFLPAGTDLDTVTPILNFLASPASAMLMGFLGPIFSPWVAVINTINDGNFADIPASFVGGLLNGADLNLDSLIPAIEGAGLLPDGTTINSIDLALGGLLSAGSDLGAGNTKAGHDYTLFDSSGSVSHSVEPVGGSLFNSLGLNLTLPEISLGAATLPGPLTVDIPSGAIGPIGAWEAWHQVMAQLLGSDWDGANTTAIAPLVGLQALAETTSDTTSAGSAAAVDALTGPLGDLANLF